MALLVLLLASLLHQSISFCDAFAPAMIGTRRLSVVISNAQRYGPMSSFDGDEDESAFDHLRRQNEVDFRRLLQKVLEMSSSSDSEDKIPSLLGRNIELIVSIQRDQVEAILSDAQKEGGPEHEQRVVDMLEYMLGFAETFVDSLKVLDDGNKQLLGKIIRAATSSSTKALQAEEELDMLLESERENLTPGFLRHLEGECERIANAPQTSPESLRLLQILRTVQVRVVEELGKSLGDEALVLGQLMGYDDPQERIAVLQAGMMIRGLEFSQNMGRMTGKALEDFRRLGNGAADPDLVERVQHIHGAIQEYLSQQLA